MIFTLRRRRLPEEFCADLPNTRIARAGHNSKVRAVDVSRRILKLRVVEDVEKFETQIESEILLDCGPLQYSEIGVVESRAVEEAAVGRVKSCKGLFRAQCRWREEPVTSRVDLVPCSWTQIRIDFNEFSS